MKRELLSVAIGAAASLLVASSAVAGTLDDVKKKGFLQSILSEPIKSRGGRSKRIYSHTQVGIKAMVEIKILQERIWDGIVVPAIPNMP